MPRFAILEHDFPTLHWDLLLEDGPTCRTWRIPVGSLVVPSPREGEGGRRPDEGEGTAATKLQELRAEALPDHRLMYLDYEGPVSGNRGNVTRWDGGTFVWITARDDCVAVLLRGAKTSGRMKLICQNDFWRADWSPAEMQQAG